MAYYLQSDFFFDRIYFTQPTKMLVMQMHLFENLDLNTKACITWRKGVHIAFRAQGKYYMSLYRLNDFYVEVQYHTCFDGIAGIKIFRCEDELEEYLDKIDIATILVQNFS